MAGRGTITGRGCGFVITAVVVAVGLAARARAQEAGFPIRAAETSIAVALSGTYGHYHEDLGSLSDDETGALPGFALGASRLGATSGGWDVYTALAYDFSGGYLGYSGFTQDGAGYNAQDRAFFNHVEVRLGSGFRLSPSVELIPFFAGGYQNWYRTITGPAGYGEFYQAGLLGAGLKLDVAASSRLVFSAAAEGLAVAQGSISAPAIGLNAGFGTSGEEVVRLGADWRLDENWHVFAGLGVTHFDYTGSKADNGYFEPPSSTLLLQSEIGMSYGF